MNVSFYTIDGYYKKYNKKIPKNVERFKLPKLNIKPPIPKLEDTVKEVVKDLPEQIRKNLAITPYQLETSGEPMINTLIIGKNFKFYDKFNNLTSLQLLDNNDICISRIDKTICLPAEEFIIKEKKDKKSKITK